MNDSPPRADSPFTPFAWDDALRLESALSEDERAIRDSAHAFCQEKLFPRVLMANRHEKFDREIMNEFGEMGFLGATLDGYGCAGVNYVSYGLICPRGRARRFRLPFRLLGAVFAGDVSDLCLRVGGAAAEISAQAAHRRIRRLLRPDRTRCRLRPCVHAHAGEEGRWRLPAERLEDLDHQRPDRRRAGGVGEGRRRRHPRLHSGARHAGPDAAEDRRKVLAARLGHRHDHDAGRLRPGRRTSFPA